MEIDSKFMTNWQKTMGNSLLKGLGIPGFELSKQNYDWLKDSIYKAKQEAINKNDTLIGHIREEYEISQWPVEFESFIIQAVGHPYLDRYRESIDVISDARPYYLNNMWVNFQKKYEFNPLHDHGGLLSFIIFVKIPFDLKEEDKIFPPNSSAFHTSRLAFVNNEASGGFTSTLIDVDKTFEGKMLLFPAKQAHMVYPFYTSDDYRITVSGNIKLKV